MLQTPPHSLQPRHAKSLRPLLPSLASKSLAPPQSRYKFSDVSPILFIHSSTEHPHVMNFLLGNSNNNNNGGEEVSYKVQVQQLSNEELLAKERSKRRRKTGDVVGTGLVAAAAMAEPALWAMAGTNVKSFLDNSSKHKILTKEISRRGLTPIKGDTSDTLFPVLASAGSMAVGRAFGGSAGQGVANQASGILQSVSSRAFSSRSCKKDKKKVFNTKSENSANGQVKQEAAPQQFALPSAYDCTPGQAPPTQLVYYYHQPTAQYPKGYYSPTPPQGAMPPPNPPMSPQNYAAPPTYQTSPMAPPPQSPQGYQPVPPALAYLNSPPPQPNNLNRTQSVYNPGPQPIYYPHGFQRSETFM